MPSDHLGLEGKRLQLQPLSPLGERSCLGEPPSKTKLEDWRLRVIQIDTSQEGGGGRGHWDTEMCDDLAWCLDTLGQSSSLHCALPGLSNTAAQQEKQEIAIQHCRLIDC